MRDRDQPIDVGCTPPSKRTRGGGNTQAPLTPALSAAAGAAAPAAAAPSATSDASKVGKRSLGPKKHGRVPTATIDALNEALDHLGYNARGHAPTESEWRLLLTQIISRWRDNLQQQGDAIGARMTVEVAEDEAVAHVANLSKEEPG